MDTAPVIQHWLVAVARAAELQGASGLDVDSNTPVEATWDVVAMSAGIGDEDLAATVAGHYRLDVADMAAVDPHAHRLIPGRVARKLRVMPLQYSDRILMVATADPTGMDAEREISHISGRNVQFQVAPPRAIQAAIADAYPDDAELRHEVEPLTPEAKGGPHVLVVDDEAEMRLLLRSVLESKGFRVAEASDGPEALAMLSGDDPFDLVTLDLQMETMHGLEVLKQIRTRVAIAAIPVVVATGSDDPEVEMELFEAGADDFIVKPLDPPRFLLRLQAVLRRREHSSFGSIL